MNNVQQVKQCKYCKQPINKQASVCPYCHKKQSSALLIVLIIVLSVLSFILLMLIVLSAIPDIETNTEKQSVISTQPKTEEQATEPISKLLYDDNNVKIYYKGIDKSKNSQDIKVYIENNTDADILVQTRDFSLNGYMIDEVFSSGISAGKKINDEITVYNSELEKNNITEIENVEFKFAIMNSDDWHDKHESENIRIDIKSN
ncbi:hypothetical protein [Ruminococcus flavefaciens]|uniref:hypothetical protein n=1 Tax=Ruminococcus flavefaciens TaxID=1265 RepID=UPI0026F07D2D|nr:hypothetical protein [Ruminococcus flavefaciens]